ncbi:MAG: endonuclease V, partial [Acidobacteria bacterium]|nr:endonuclease V [Acidobacteriota bacterium]
MAQYERLHEWKMTPREAVLLQKELRERVRLAPLTRPVETIAGADISFNKFSETIYAGIVVLRLPSLEVVEEVCIVSETRFPYVPGLLSFRESPAVLEAWAKLRTEPDAVMFDGQGIAHPRRLGIAAHVGLWLKLPSVGCAKSRLFGT